MNGGLPGPNTTDTITGGKTLELSKYDKVRKPHKANTEDDITIKVTARTLSTELCCPICLDLLTCTMTTKECLHRFCSECITTALMRGNKECPTCRKKIVSKRSLRPDPNFDFLISKIWPDRKLYDAELNASMQLFQEQSNVSSLQKSIEEGIRAQATYRKQRVQGSYDYEKRKRRPKLVDPNSAIPIAGATSADNNGAGGEQQPIAEGGDVGDSMVEQVVVSLTPVEGLEVESPGGGGGGAVTATDSPRQLLSTAGAALMYSSSDESDTSSEISSDDSSDLSSDSSLSESSSDVSNPSTSSRSVIMDQNGQKSAISVNGMPNLNSSTPASPMMTGNSECSESQNSADISMDVVKAEERRRKGEEIEVELAPSKMLLSRGPVPAHLHCSHFIRAPAEISIGHLGEFLLLLNHQATAEAESPRKDCRGGEGGAGTLSGTTASSTTTHSPQPLSSRPDCFYILDQCYQLRKLCPQETLCSAFLVSVQWDRHLTIFFDLLDSCDGDERKEGDIAEVIGEELAKMAVGARRECEEKGESVRECRVKEEVKEEAAEEMMMEVMGMETDQEQRQEKTAMKEAEGEGTVHQIKMETD